VDFEWSAADLAYRSEIRVLLRSLVPEDRGRFRPGVEHSVEGSRAVCERLASSGHLVPHWPTAVGGGAESVWRQVIVGEEMWRMGEPRAPQYLNVNFIGPAIIQFGTPEQQQRYLPDIVKGRALWCQAFSEPDAGSDLSRIRTTATAVDGGYVIRGVKAWISYAEIAEHCFLLARVPGESEQAGRGRTLFLVDMDIAGVTVTDVASIVGSHTFHEIHFDDVFLPADAVLGAPGAGWDIVRAALVNERAGAAEYCQVESALDAALRAGGEHDAEAALGEAYLRCAGARLLAYEAVSQGPDDSRSRAASQARAYLGAARQAGADALEACLTDSGVSAESQGVDLLNAIIGGITGGAYEVLLDLLTRSRSAVG
jgi:alkylation response protein AidB-like acyl-CoA dehydrogenase